MTAYRDDLAALEARRAALDAEIAERTRERDEAAQMLADARRTADAQAWLDGAAERDRRFRRKVAIGAALLATAIAAVVTVKIVFHAPDQIEQALQQFEAWTDKLCMCKDKACADAVNDGLMKWSTEMAREWHDPPHLSHDQERRAGDISQRMMQCMTKLNAAP